MNGFDFYIPTRILFGAGKLAELGRTPLPGRRALVVISAGQAMRRSGYLDRVLALLKDNHAEAVLFDRILPNPVLRHVMEGAAVARQEQCDFVLGLGGGSTMDSAKAIAVMATNPGDYWDYVDSGSGGAKPLVRAPLPIVAVTTTAGTGTEADPWAVITHEERREKIGFGSPGMFPALSIVDPELMLTVPPQLTAFQGFDAFFHAAEGFLATVASPMSDLLALKSMELIARHLPDAVRNGADLEARAQVALANTLSGMVESVSCCTSEHAMEHAMSAFHPNLPHGAGLIMLSGAYFSFFADKAPERFAAMARAMGAAADPGAMVPTLLKLQRACGVSGLKMSDYGITEEELPQLADNAMGTLGGLFALDRYRLSREETVAIFRAAWK